MTIDVSGFGIQIAIQASRTFPTGFLVTAVADDADPVDSASIQIGDKAMGVNGDLIVWSKGNAIPMTLNVIPGSNDDINLQILARANRPARGRRAVRDIITAVITYPSGNITRLLRGVITDAILANGVASAGRIKTKPYIFAFEDVQ